MYATAFSSLKTRGIIYSAGSAHRFEGYFPCSRRIFQAPAIGVSIIRGVNVSRELECEDVEHGGGPKQTRYMRSRVQFFCTLEITLRLPLVILHVAAGSACDVVALPSSTACGDDATTTTTTMN
jgi:hypothetical protein